MLRQVDAEPATRIERGLTVRGLAKQFDGTPVLKGIDLDVARGELITVLGPSGSGKTTLLRLVCGFEQADAGQITIGDALVADGHAHHWAPEKRGIGYVAQEGALFPHLSVADNLLFGLPRRVRRGSRAERLRRVSELLELVGLPAGYATRKPSMLSGGEQQRIALARALAPDPAMVLLDEPFSALDAGLRAGLREAVAASLRQVGATALLVTHDQNEALSMGDRVAVMQNGRLAQVATPQMLYRHPVNRGIAEFVGEAVMVPGTADGTFVDCCFGRLPLTKSSRHAQSAAVDVMIRPEQFVLDPADATASATVEHCIYYGHDARVFLHTAAGHAFVASVGGGNLPEAGQTVHFRIDGQVAAYPRT